MKIVIGGGRGDDLDFSHELGPLQVTSWASVFGRRGSRHVAQTQRWRIPAQLHAVVAARVENLLRLKLDCLMET